MQLTQGQVTARAVNLQMRVEFFPCEGCVRSAYWIFFQYCHPVAHY